MEHGVLIAERSYAAARTWTDEHLEFWGEVYLDHPAIAARGVLFEFFLGHPVAVLTALNLPCPRPQQVEISPRIAWFLTALEREGARCSNGTLIEKLRHRRIQRTRHRRRDIDGRLV